MPDDTMGAAEESPSESARLAVMAELYNEVRAYRDKEFTTFQFAFPIIGTGYVLDTPSNALKALLTTFAVATVFYLFGNLRRAQRIKGAIERVQDDLHVNAAFSDLVTTKERSWSKKPWYKHLGTVVYLLLLCGETLGLWLVA
jgi:hypothetical protein